MIIRTRECINLPVQTRGGQPLGVILDIELDADAHQVRSYHVGISRLMFWKRVVYVIVPDQVVSLTNEVMIVSDALIPVKTHTASIPLKQVPEETLPSINNSSQDVG